MPKSGVMEQLRLFVAIELDSTLRGELIETGRRLEDALRDRPVPPNSVRWVAPSAIHLTLKFLGNVSEPRVAEISAALTRAAAEISPFQLTARGLGSFSNAGLVIWAGLEGDLAPAALLSRRIEDEFARLGFAREKHGFAPHLTLGRVKRVGSNQARHAIATAIKDFPVITFGTLNVQAISLISSNMQPSGPIYTTLATINLPVH